MYWLDYLLRRRLVCVDRYVSSCQFITYVEPLRSSLNGLLPSKCDPAYTARQNTIQWQYDLRCHCLCIVGPRTRFSVPRINIGYKVIMMTLHLGKNFVFSLILYALGWRCPFCLWCVNVYSMVFYLVDHVTSYRKCVVLVCRPRNFWNNISRTKV